MPYYVFKFSSGRFDGYVIGEWPSSECALLACCHGERFIETAIVVHPKKGRRSNPVTHKMAHLEDAHRGVWFLAAVEKDAFERMCEAAELEWAEEKGRLRQRIGWIDHNTNNARLDGLPADLRDRIRTDGRGCWLWVSRIGRTSGGKRQQLSRVRRKVYGHATFGGRRWAAHRLVYTLLIGEIPIDAILLHSCDIPACVNPAHLTLGTIEDNVRDMLGKGRGAWQKDPAA
jgi:hypothetical protein